MHTPAISCLAVFIFVGACASGPSSSNTTATAQSPNVAPSTSSVEDGRLRVDRYGHNDFRGLRGRTDVTDLEVVGSDLGTRGFEDLVELPRLRRVILRDSLFGLESDRYFLSVRPDAQIDYGNGRIAGPHEKPAVRLRIIRGKEGPELVQDQPKGLIDYCHCLLRIEYFDGEKTFGVHQRFDTTTGWQDDSTFLSLSTKLPAHPEGATLAKVTAKWFAFNRSVVLSDDENSKKINEQNSAMWKQFTTATKTPNCWSFEIWPTAPSDVEGQLRAYGRESRILLAVNEEFHLAR